MYIASKYDELFVLRYFILIITIYSNKTGLMQFFIKNIMDKITVAFPHIKVT